MGRGNGRKGRWGLGEGKGEALYLQTISWKTIKTRSIISESINVKAKLWEVCRGNLDYYIPKF